MADHKRKRASLESQFQIEDISTKRRNFSRIRKSHNFESRDDTRTEACARCTELKIPHLLSSLKRNEKLGWFSEVIVQRLVFDTDECASLKNCYAYAELKDIGRWCTLNPSLTPLKGLSKDECQKLLSKSWVHLEGTRIFRYTEPSDFHIFSRGTFNNLQNSCWRREIFDRRCLTVSPQPDYEATKEWLYHCSRNHLKCQPRQSHALRLISLIDTETQCLVPYPTGDGAQCDYLALSYVWGDYKQDFVKNNSIPKVLPETIADSIKVVKALGKRYLWVDSICIDQSNEVEKKTQIDMMDIIYQSAFATIIALDGENANAGIPGVGNHSKRTPQLTSMPPSLKDQLAHSKWVRRAWTYQEGMLSRRRLLFTKHQLYFACNEMSCCESYDNVVNIGSGSTGGAEYGEIPWCIKDPILSQDELGYTREGGRRLYQCILSAYTSRQLSNDEDTLNAISALLTCLEKSSFGNDKGFFFGLPLVDFRASMLWHWDGFTSGGMRKNEAMRRAASNIPSWSWAAWISENNIILPPIDDEWPSLAKSVQAPLKILSRGAETIVDDLSPNQQSGSSKEETSQDEAQNISAEDERKILQIISATQKFYQRCRAGTICETTTNTILKDFHLRVEGILLNLACTVVLYSGRNYGLRWRTDDPFLVPKLVLPDDLNDSSDFNGLNYQPCLYDWKNDTHINDVAQAPVEINDGEDKLGNQNDGRSHHHEIRRHDFLLVSALTNVDDNWGRGSGLNLDLLHLYWRDGVATRGGVVTIFVKYDYVERFWQICEARTCAFWLG